MSVPYHLDIVKRIHAQGPPDGTPEPTLAFLLKLIRALPANERAGLHRRPGPPAENVALYQGGWVGISRLMYPDGGLVKVIADCGPGGANSPTWNVEEAIAPDRYVAVTPAGSEPEKQPEASPPPDRPTYDQFIKGDDAYVKQIARALKEFRGGWSETDLAHFFYAMYQDGRSLQSVLQEIRR